MAHFKKNDRQVKTKVKLISAEVVACLFLTKGPHIFMFAIV